MVSRIISLLKRNKQGLSLTKIAAKMSLSSKERATLKQTLQKLEDRGVILYLRKKYFLRPRANIIRGTLVTSMPGFGFVRPQEDYGEDVFIPAKHSGGALLGDTVEVFVKERGRRGKPEGRIIRVLERKREELFGLYKERAGNPFVQPFESHLDGDIGIKDTSGLQVAEGHVVSVERETLKLIRILGYPQDPGVDTQVVIQKHGLKSSFDSQTQKEADSVPSKIPQDAYLGRVDYRTWTTVTIDGENAKDFDDAVSVRKLEGENILLGVHIADVSHYVEPDTALDMEAQTRGTSVYFPDSTLPMFPENISNVICSLRPRENKLTVSVLLEIDKEGNTVSSEFHPSVICTQERMTYNSVFKILEGDSEKRKKFKRLVPDLLLMQELAQRLRKRRLRQGSLDFDLAEPELIYEEGNLLSILPLARNEAHRLIEEFMVAANVAVAEFLRKKGIPQIFRIHPSPSLESLTRLREMLDFLGITLPLANKIKSKDLQRAIDLAAGKPEEKFLNLQVLKSQSLAIYSEQNVGHYGLAKRDYSHFTSPIRRYPDLVVHRILKQALQGEKGKHMDLESIAEHCSETERNADEAERALIEWRILRFLKDKLGDELDGIIVNVSKAGIFVELDNYFVDGLLPFADLGAEYFVRKREKLVIGRKTGKTYSLGQRIKVVLAAVDPILRRITLSLPK